MKSHPHNICLFLIHFAEFQTLLLHLAAPRDSPLPSFYLFFLPRHLHGLYKQPPAPGWGGEGSPQGGQADL